MREPSLLTTRLVVRDITELDARALLELDADPEVMRYIGDRPATTIDWYRDRIRNVYMLNLSHPWHGIRIIEDRTTGQFLGWIFIRPAIKAQFAAEIGWTDPNAEEIGYRLQQSAWGQGIATEAANILLQIAENDTQTKSIVACAHAENARSIRVLQKLGLLQVGNCFLDECGKPVVKLEKVLQRQ